MSGAAARDAVARNREPKVYLILVGPSYGGRSVETDPKTGRTKVTTRHELGDRLARYARQLQEEYETKNPRFRRGVDRAVIAQFLGLETFVRAWNRDYGGHLYKVDVLSHGAEDGIGAGGDAEGRNSKPEVTTADLRQVRLHPLEPGGMVVLWGCLTGAADQRYGRSFASELAEHLGAPVRATPGFDIYRSKLLSADQDVGPDKLTGEWRMFYPPGGKPPPL